MNTKLSNLIRYARPYTSDFSINQIMNDKRVKLIHIRQSSGFNLKQTREMSFPLRLFTSTSPMILTHNNVSNDDSNMCRWGQK